DHSMLTFLRIAFFACASCASSGIAIASDSANAATVATPSPAAATLQETLTLAVTERRVVTFVYQGQARTVEPHACGITITSGEAVPHGDQTGGGSASGIPPGWRTFPVAKIGECVVTDKTFAAPRQDYSAGRPNLDPVWAEVTVAAKVAATATPAP